MILSDKDILRRLENGSLRVEPIDKPKLQIQPASVDLRLGNAFLEFQQTNIPYIHPKNNEEINKHTSETNISDNDDFILHPGDFVLGTTKEYVEIPLDLIAHVEGRSSLGRLAVIVHATAGLIDPGYKGQITLELSNLGTTPVALSPGMRVSQLTFTKLSSEVERPYGDERGSKYQKQCGPQASRINHDNEFKNNQ